MASAQNSGAIPATGRQRNQRWNKHKAPLEKKQYFETEEEAQAWEDHCSNALEAPAPQQFLQTMTKESAKQQVSNASAIVNS